MLSSIPTKIYKFEQYTFIIFNQCIINQKIEQILFLIYIIASTVRIL